MPKNIEIKKSTLSTATMVFIYIPILIFLFGFTRIYWAVAASLAVSYGFYRYVRYARGKGGEGDDESITLNLGVLFLCLFICLLAGLVSGWGGFFCQRDDWSKTNAVLRDLTEHEWPVYYVNGEEHAALTYYIAGYLIPAVIGKIFNSFSAAELTMFLYFTVGLFLLFLNALIYIKISDPRKVMIFLAGMILFGGALILSQFLTALMYPGVDWFFSGGDIRTEGLRLCYRSVMIDLRWVPNQFIFPCLCGMVFLNTKKDVGDYVWMLLPALLYGAFSFLGALPVALACAVYYLAKKEIQLRNIFSLSNIIMSLAPGLMIILYLWGNISSEKPDGLGFGLMTYSGGRLIGVYLVFCLFMFGISALIVGKRYRNDPVFVTVIALLLIIPFGRMGIENDWVLGVPTIPLFFLMLFIWEYIFHEKGVKIRKGLLITLLAIGAVYPAGHICQSVSSTAQNFAAEGRFNGRKDDYGTMQRYASRTLDEDEALKYNYFTYDPEDDIFYKYIAGKQFEEED